MLESPLAFLASEIIIFRIIVIIIILNYQLTAMVVKNGIAVVVKSSTLVVEEGSVKVLSGMLPEVDSETVVDSRVVVSMGSVVVVISGGHIG
jgi:hypothetical protein